MADNDRIGTKDKRPKLTICGHKVGEQIRFSVGIGQGRYVIVGHSDADYEDEIEKLKAARPKPPLRIHKRGVVDEQQEAESDS